MRTSTLLGSLRARLLLFVTLAVLPALIAIVYAGVQQHRAAEEHAREQALTTARTTEHAIAEMRQNSLLTLSMLTNIIQVTALSPSACDALLVKLSKDHPEFVNIGIISDAGTLVCSAHPTSGPTYLGDRDYFRRVIESKAVVAGMYQIDRVQHVPTAVFAAPLLSPQGSVHAIAFVSLSLDWLNAAVSKIRTPSGSFLLILNQQGIALASEPDPEKWIGHKVSSFCQPPHPDCLQDEGFTMSTWPDGVERIFGYTSAQDPNGVTALTVLYGIPQSQILATAGNVLVTHLGILAVIVFFIYLLAWYGGDVLVLRNLKNLLTAIRAIKAGDSNARTRISGPRELALIGDAFNAMAENIQTKSQQITKQMESIQRLLRIYRVLSSINASILRIHVEEELLNAACRIAVEQGGFITTWIGQVDKQTERVMPVAHAGVGRQFVYGTIVSMRAEIPEGRGTVGTMLRTREPVIDNDVATSERLAPWREAMLALGCHAVASFPIIYGDELYGNLTLHASESHFFDGEEVSLLRQLAADTAIGLKQIRTENALQHLAYFDRVTSLPNRRLFEDRTEQTLARARHDDIKAIVLAVKIEEIDRIDDALGRHRVDGILQAIAAQLKVPIHSGDSIAKLSHDTFGICMLIYPGEDILRATSNVMQLFPMKLNISGESVVISTQAGASLFPADGDTALTLIRNAEVSLRNTSHESGAVCNFYSPAIDLQAERRFSLEKELHFAIERNELSLVYQPVFDLPDRHLIGVEALLRWNNKSLGVVPPTEFIAIAEQAGLIVQIGEWALRESCLQALKWQQSDLPPLCISINVSLIQLHESDFLDRLQEILTGLKFDPNTIPLALEITESEMAYNVNETIAILEAIRALGIRVYMDDFGTGYSSLGYLKRMPINALKIDQLFVKDLDKNTGDKEFIRMIVSLTQSLGINTIAEGVETQQQSAILESLGCNALQGYLLGRPMPPDDISLLMEKSML